MSRFIRIIVLVSLVGWLPSEARAVSVTGDCWIVHFNLPDQNTTLSTLSADEYCIREALLARINQLQSGQTGTLCTYTFSGNTAAAGAAGPIITAITCALDRGATVRFVADSAVDIYSEFNGTNSLNTLALRGVNPLQLSEDNSVYGIMHDKLGVFDFGDTNKWVFIASWNFTGGASSQQWNIGLEIQNTTLFNAYNLEMTELLAGRFHDHGEKSHAHDNTSFSLPGAWGDGQCRFAPYPEGFDGGNNAMTQVSALISNAQDEIVFALNKLTLTIIQHSLVSAADRGVMIFGVIPQSDITGASSEVYAYLNNPAHYATTNRVHFITPFSKADGSAYDTGETDLVHEKYMVIDPWHHAPITIHGSANWTYTALGSTSGNDENLVLLRHRDIARIFYAQFKRMTGLRAQENASWCAFSGKTPPQGLCLWMSDTALTNTWIYTLEQAPALDGPWTRLQNHITGGIHRVTQPIAPANQAFYRATRAVP
ncbi:MAG: hypothetical protein EOM20_06985 [Spartobacteria bacterium]|nr:hypothetical protein [Spartobacteria bacterium]